MTCIFPSAINDIIQEYCCYKPPFEKELILVTSGTRYHSTIYWSYGSYCVNLRRRRLDAKFKFKKDKDKIWEIIFICDRGERLPGKGDLNSLFDLLIG